MGVKAELALEAFMHDCDEATIDETLERLTRAVAWREKPSTHVALRNGRPLEVAGTRRP
jgi:hypothetical protein